MEGLPGQLRSEAAAGRSSRRTAAGNSVRGESGRAGGTQAAGWAGVGRRRDRRHRGPNQRYRCCYVRPGHNRGGEGRADWRHDAVRAGGQIQCLSHVDQIRASAQLWIGLEQRFIAHTGNARDLVERLAGSYQIGCAPNFTRIVRTIEGDWCRRRGGRLFSNGRSSRLWRTHCGFRHGRSSRLLSCSGLSGRQGRRRRRRGGDGRR